MSSPLQGLQRPHQPLQRGKKVAPECPPKKGQHQDRPHHHDPRHAPTEDPMLPSKLPLEIHLKPLRNIHTRRQRFLTFHQRRRDLARSGKHPHELDHRPTVHPQSSIPQLPVIEPDPTVLVQDRLEHRTVFRFLHRPQPVPRHRHPLGPDIHHHPTTPVRGNLQIHVRRHHHGRRIQPPPHVRVVPSSVSHHDHPVLIHPDPPMLDAKKREAEWQIHHRKLARNGAPPEIAPLQIH